LAIPGEALRPWRRAAPSLALAAWVAWLASELMPIAVTGGVVWPVAAGWGCVAKAFSVGVSPGIVLAVMIGRSAPAEVRGVVTFAALAAAAVGALGVEMTCPLTGPMHLLLWHAGPVLVVVVLAGAFGRAAVAFAKTRFAGRP
jgi:hypothetical protein